MKVLTSDNTILTSDGLELYAPDDGLQKAVCLFGVAQQHQRPLSVDPDTLTKRATPITDRLTVEYPDQEGYLILMIPLATARRVRWQTTPNNKGPIGGSPDGPLANLFPDPTTITYEHSMYQLYVSSYITRLTEPITFIA